MKQTRIGLIGCGNWGKNILRDLKLLGCYVAVVTRSVQNQQVAKNLGADAICNSIAQLADEKIMGAIISTPTVTHADVIRQSVSLEVPLFVEKPLCIHNTDAQEILKHWGNQVFIMDKWRYHPGVQALAEIARHEKLGTVLGIQTYRLGWGNPHPDVDGVWILAPHDLSIGLEILGQIPKPRAAVAAFTGTEVTGLTGVLGESPWLTIQVSTTYRRRCREVRLECRNGIAILSDAYSDHIEIIHTDRKQQTPEKFKISTDLPLYVELKTFIEYLHGGSPPRSSVQEGALIVQAVNELRQLAGIEEGNYGISSYRSHSYA